MAQMVANRRGRLGSVFSGSGTSVVNPVSVVAAMSATGGTPTSVIQCAPNNSAASGSGGSSSGNASSSNSIVGTATSIVISSDSSSSSSPEEESVSGNCSRDVSPSREPSTSSSSGTTSSSNAAGGSGGSANGATSSNTNTTSNANGNNGGGSNNTSNSAVGGNGGNNTGSGTTTAGSGTATGGTSTGTTGSPVTGVASAISGFTGGLTDELAALFECPVCFEIVVPPIMQCQVGHLICASCRPKLSCCPTCRGILGNIRNLAMEKVANNLMFPCKHKGFGCRLSFGLNEKPEHEEVCEFRPYNCPCPGSSCSWQGQLDKVMVHLQHSHKNITTLNGEDIVFLATEINLAGAVDWVMMQSCFGQHFMLVLEKQERADGHTQFFAVVQLIGSPKQAQHFAYRLELNGNRRRLIWEAMPRSSHEGVASAIMSSDCLAFDNTIAQHFADNGNLGINVTISLVC